MKRLVNVYLCTFSSDSKNKCWIFVHSQQSSFVTISPSGLCPTFIFSSKKCKNKTKPKCTENWTLFYTAQVSFCLSLCSSFPTLSLWQTLRKPSSLSFYLSGFDFLLYISLHCPSVNQYSLIVFFCLFVSSVWSFFRLSQLFLSRFFMFVISLSFSSLFLYFIYLFLFLFIFTLSVTSS